ncbi:hypothetical protein A3K93_05800 [Acinetobacter sp. NCu2D-2]|uniref:bifunctional alpha/beta hydrolase/class I SAM-dependent methyltransferase n=1 Tax=Acinetobacter sp. NCu2D-2 TaxID=1608473 RepID=UPI0007CDAED9|nr:bifunctional alpha/beta hydrolase/class I SAM-dependent methyltransferase [Acinetobacter sp. NCu2D-2]ANF81746.1 hypothetical protein A3K93_05800 [Acinetobacter sp. NCu2D-2]
MYKNNQNQFITHDGTPLFYQHWSSSHNQNNAARKAILLFHRGHEHSDRMAHLVNELQLDDFDFFAWDARGHGNSPGERGDAPSFSACVKDIQFFVKHLQQHYGIAPQNIAVVAQSVGAVLAATWVHDYAPKIRALCLASPAFDIKLYIPFAKQGLTAMQKIRGNFFVNSYVKAKMLTHDRDRSQSYEHDPKIARAISVRMLLGLYEASKRIVEDAAHIYVPTQVLSSGADFVVHQKPQKAFFDKLPNPLKEFHVLEGFYHDTLGEKDRAIAVEKIRRFIQQCFKQPYTAPELLHADKIGHSCAVAEQLSTHLPEGSLKQRFWDLTKQNLKIGSHFSRGLEIGEQTGYDSGSTLDFVYRNQPESHNLIGKLIDHYYLNAIGWRGIRVRKQHIEQLFTQYANTLLKQGKELHVMDIAAGHGRYILDAIHALSVPPKSVTLRDYSPINVESGQKLIRERGLSDTVQFIQADAFDEQSLASTEPKVNFAVVSGLYELFSDNALIRQSLRGIYQAMQDEGYLLYTGQIWHPQQEFIARALSSHRQGQAWVMRLRSQAEMDALVEAEGFEKIDQCIDEFGIFTVSVARKIQK